MPGSRSPLGAPTCPLRRTLLLSLLAAAAAAQDSTPNVKIDITKAVKCQRPSQEGDQLAVHYNGTLVDGTMFDSSYQRNIPFTFPLGAGMVIRGWDLGMVSMCPGEERTLTVPPELGYGHRDMGEIPPDSTLIFQTKLVEIVGVEAGVITEDTAIPAQPDTMEQSAPNGAIDEAADTAADEVPDAAEDKSEASVMVSENGECKLLGPFALFVQGALGILAMFSLVLKRFRERPRRPLKIWSFDASKQVFGSALLHVFNVLMSMLSSGAVQLKAAAKGSNDANPCSFYLINIAVDTTIGIPILVLLLKVLHQAALITPLANPPESIKSGYYGEPPRATWWLKQSVIYFVGLLLMKLCVFFIFELFPWIVWVGNWALRWTEGSEALQIAFVMFVFPVIMNAIQYYIIDTFIKDGSSTPHGHEAVATEDEDEDDHDGHGRAGTGLADEWSEDEGLEASSRIPDEADKTGSLGSRGQRVGNAEGENAK